MDIKGLKLIIDPMKQMFPEQPELGFNFVMRIHDLNYNLDREPNIEALSEGVEF